MHFSVRFTCIGQSPGEFCHRKMISPLSPSASGNEYKRPGEMPLLVFWSHVWIPGNTQPKSIDTLYLAGRQVFTVEMTIDGPEPLGNIVRLIGYVRNINPVADNPALPDRRFHLDRLGLPVPTDTVGGLLYDIVNPITFQAQSGTSASPSAMAISRPFSSSFVIGSPPSTL